MARPRGLDVQGLVGSTTDGGGYAFAMNTFEWAGALVPLARYDTRYAHDIGKWTLNLANAARLFYPNAFDTAHQSSPEWAAAHDSKSVIAYEGIRKWKRGAKTATADYRTSSGNILQGSFASTTFRGESPPDCEIFEESAGSDKPFAQTWEFDLPEAPARWLVVDAERIDGGHVDNAFRFSYCKFARRPVYAGVFGLRRRSRPKSSSCLPRSTASFISKPKAAADPPTPTSATRSRSTRWQSPTSRTPAPSHKATRSSPSSTSSMKPPFRSSSIAPSRPPPTSVSTAARTPEFSAASSARRTSKAFFSSTS